LKINNDRIVVTLLIMEWSATPAPARLPTQYGVVRTGVHRVVEPQHGVEQVDQMPVGRLAAGAPLLRQDRQVVGAVEDRVEDVEPVGRGVPGGEPGDQATQADRYLTGPGADVTADAAARFVTPDELLRDSDFMSIHTALTDRTRHLLDAGRLARIKPDADLVNTARGPIVDEAARADADRSGRPAGHPNSSVNAHLIKEPRA
jgi:hypothetical protein